MANRNLFAKLEVRNSLRSDAIVITTDVRTDSIFQEPYIIGCRFIFYVYINMTKTAQFLAYLIRFTYCFSVEAVSKPRLFCYFSMFSKVLYCFEQIWDAESY